MITIEDIKQELRISDATEDASIQKTIIRVQEFIKSYCKNSSIDFESSAGLDDLVLYLCVQRLNPETRLRAGKTGENQGFSTSFTDDIPKEYKKALMPFKRLSFS